MAALQVGGGLGEATFLRQHEAAEPADAVRVAVGDAVERRPGGPQVARHGFDEAQEQPRVGPVGERAQPGGRARVVEQHPRPAEADGDVRGNTGGDVRELRTRQAIARIATVVGGPRRRRGNGQCERRVDRGAFRGRDGDQGGLPRSAHPGGDGRRQARDPVDERGIGGGGVGPLPGERAHAVEEPVAGARRVRVDQDERAVHQPFDDVERRRPRHLQRREHVLEPGQRRAGGNAASAHSPRWSSGKSRS